ncbi:MAG: DUF1674 domain-containing protein [Proteobacteria bacterium]|nr:DUF1674 domain-containing protein [Pseudomonadota bacterium]
MADDKKTDDVKPAETTKTPVADIGQKDVPPVETGGRKKGLDPTRYGDWEKNGRAIDF